MSGIVVEVSARKFSVPHECVCCARTPQLYLSASYTRVTGKRVIRETTRSLDFPYCNGCNEHVKAWNFASSVTHFFLVLGIISGIGIGFAGGGAGGWAAALGLWGIGIVLGIVQRNKAKAMCSHECTTPRASVRHLGWNGSVSSFSFASTRYAVGFASSNGKKLVNVSMNLRNLLQGAQPHGGRGNVALTRTP